MFYNGSSEGMSELSAGITVYLFNVTMMHYLGEQGVAAFTATNYVLFIGTTIFLGISDGCIPIMSYNFGAGRLDRVKAVLRIAFRTNLGLGILLFSVLFFDFLWCVFEMVFFIIVYQRFGFAPMIDFRWFGCIPNC